ncbi:MAG: adenylate cyclase, partial [Actinomycetota bacterium]
SVVAGNVGTETRSEYTVVGAPVNEAARLAEQAKQTPRRVLVSAATISEAPDEAAEWASAGALSLRGIGDVEAFTSREDASA